MNQFNPSNIPAQKNFSLVPQLNMPRSVFNRSFSYKTTFDAGYIIPWMLQEILPGDTVDLKAQFFGRLLSPMEFPIMDNIMLDVHYFFVPNRLTLANWMRLMGERDPDPDSSIDYTVPKITVPLNGFQVGSVADYFGIPTDVQANEGYTQISAIPFRGLNKIWNDWYRVEYLQDSLTVNTGAGPDVIATYPLPRRNKRFDYFTSCLISPQKGDPVTIPSFEAYQATVQGNGMTLGIDTGSSLGAPYLHNESSSLRWRFGTSAYGDPIGTATTAGGSGDGVGIGVTEDPDNSGLVANILAGSAITINELREAFAIQQILELDNRGGTRYPEILYRQFGINIPDFRVQRSEFLGGHTINLHVNPVTQSTYIGSETPTLQDGVGSQAAYGVINGQGRCSHSFQEHGYLFGVMSARADLNYQHGLERHWLRTDRYDFYTPIFAHLGEQAVTQAEIFWTDNDTLDPIVFGYQERWAEYRFNFNKITGKLRSTAADSLDVWHLAQEFESAPTLALNGTFIQENPPIDRVITVTDQPHFIIDIWAELKHARVMPMYSNPGLGRL